MLSEMAQAFLKEVEVGYSTTPVICGAVKFEEGNLLVLKHCCAVLLHGCKVYSRNRPLRPMTFGASSSVCAYTYT
jgi:hypothetical protein